jgi:hypothetical protein
MGEGGVGQARYKLESCSTDDSFFAFIKEEANENGANFKTHMWIYGKR